jgi:hypothetical protein
MSSTASLWIAALVIPLSACTTMQQTVVTSPGAAQPSRAIVVPVAARPGTFRAFSKTVAAGTTMRLDFASNVNPDCTSAGLTTIRVTQQPVHGGTRVEQTRDFPRFPPINARFACNKTKVPGMALLYTPASGFTGSDYLAFETISIEGVDREFRVALTVK